MWQCNFERAFQPHYESPEISHLLWKADIDHCNLGQNMLKQRHCPLLSLFRRLLFSPINLYFQEHQLNNSWYGTGMKRKSNGRGGSIRQLCLQIIDIKVLFGVSKKKRWHKADSNRANILLSHIWRFCHGFSVTQGSGTTTEFLSPPPSPRAATVPSHHEVLCMQSLDSQLRNLAGYCVSFSRSVPEKGKKKKVSNKHSH